MEWSLGDVAPALLIACFGLLALGLSQLARIQKEAIAHSRGVSADEADRIYRRDYSDGDGPHSKKFGAYQSESDDFVFARDNAIKSQTKSVEAEIMDWADDITYSVHDLEDFHEAGLIPLDRLIADDQERELFFARTKTRWKETRHPGLTKFADHKDAFIALLKWLPQASVAFSFQRCRDGNRRRCLFPEGALASEDLLVRRIWRFRLPEMISQRKGCGE